MSVKSCIRILKELVENKTDENLSLLSDIELLSFVYKLRLDNNIQDLIEILKEWEVEPGNTFGAILKVNTPTTFMIIAIEGYYKFTNEKVVERALDMSEDY